MADSTPKRHGYLPGEMAAFEKMGPEERIRAILSNKAPQDQRFLSLFWEEQLRLHKVTLLSPKHAIVTFAFKVDIYYCNASNNLHGGAQSAMFDMCTSTALLAIGTRNFWINGGVSRSLNVTFLRPAPEGEDCLMECEVVNMGKSLALLHGVLKREKDGVVLSTCAHDKAAVLTKPGWKI